MDQPVPAYDIDKIRYATDPPTFQRAVELYQQSKVIDFTPMADSFRATVLGTQAYLPRISHFRSSLVLALGRKLVSKYVGKTKCPGQSAHVSCTVPFSK